MSLNFASTSDRCYRADNDADGTALDFSRSEDWTIALFARFEDLGGPNNCAVLTKYISTSNRNQTLFRVTDGSLPTSLHLYRYNRKFNEGFSAEDTWYLISCSHASSSGELTLYIFEMDGSAAIDGETATADADVSDLSAPIEIGAWNEGAKDPMKGDIANVAYFSSTLNRSQVTSYLRSPANFVASRTDCEFYLPMLGTDASSEPDWSGNGRNFIREGCTIGDNPPVATLGFDLGWEGTFGAAAAPGGSVPVAMHNYRRRRA